MITETQHHSPHGKNCKTNALMLCWLRRTVEWRAGIKAVERSMLHIYSMKNYCPLMHVMCYLFNSLFHIFKKYFILSFLNITVIYFQIIM